MKIYTRSGDTGETGLPNGSRVPKDAPVPEACGTVDELNAVLGRVRAETVPDEIDRLLEGIQHELCDVGTALAGVPSGSLGPQQVTALERAIDEHQQRLPPLEQFILPGGTPPAAALHVARTVCRRAERRLASLAGDADRELPAWLPAYFNRLGDLLFVLARTVNALAGCTDVPWRKNAQR